MSLDITIKERKEFRCPDCGCLVMSQDIDAECSGGRVWYDFIVKPGWYESIHNWDDYSVVGIEGIVTHWMPLPEPIEEA